MFFRHEASKRARAAGLAGWIRNRADGRVEALFEGPEREVESLIEWCRTGPSMARVDDVEVSREPIQATETSDFRPR